MRVIIINGLGASGKDTFVELFTRYATLENEKVSNISTIDPIRKLVNDFVPENKNDSEYRELLHKFKMYWSKTVDGSFNYVKNTVNKYINDYDYIFVHSREVEEIERFKSEFGATTLLITANIKSNETKYISDQINNIDYDNVIFNDHSKGLKSLQTITKLYYDYLKMDK